MRVADVMSPDVFAVGPDTSLETTARLLATKQISGAPVVADDRIVGVITLSDLVDPDQPPSDHNGYPLFYRIARGATQEIGGDVVAGQGMVSDVMSPFVLSIDSSAPLREAGARMVAEDVHRLLVIDQQKLVGIVSSLDVIRGMLRTVP